jgi:hypothetical protein
MREKGSENIEESKACGFKEEPSPGGKMEKSGKPKASFQRPHAELTMYFQSLPL